MSLSPQPTVETSLQQDAAAVNQVIEDLQAQDNELTSPNKRRARSQESSGDPDEKERKRQRRLLQNRQSASLSRQRKKEFLGNLERRSNDVDSENKLLKQQLTITDQRFRELEQKYGILLKQNEDLKFLLKNSDKADELNRILAQTYTAYIQASGLAVERSVLLGADQKLPIDHAFVGVQHEQQAREQEQLLQGLQAQQLHHHASPGGGDSSFDVTEEAGLSPGPQTPTVKTK